MQTQITEVPYIEERFPNGSRLLIFPDEAASETAVSIVYPGSRYDPKLYLGHVTEHMMADRYPYPHFTQFATALDRRTTGFEAGIGRETMTFSFVTMPDDFPNLVDLARTMLIHKRFSAKSLSGEFGGLAVEEKIGDDKVDGILQDTADELVYGKHPLGQRFYSSREEMARITVDDVRAWHNRITRSPCVIAVCGRVDHRSARRILRNRFGFRRSLGPIRTPLFRATQNKLRLRLVEWPVQLAHIAVVIPFPVGLAHPHRVVLSAMCNHLGESQRWSNRLFIRLAGKENGQDRLVYGVYADVWHFQECGRLEIVTETEPRNVPAVLRGICQELHRLKKQLLTPEQMSDVQRWSYVIAERRRRDPLDYSQFLGEQAFVAGQPVTSQMFVECFERLVIPDSIRRLAKCYLKRQKTSVVIFGAVGGLNRRQIARAIEF